MNKKVKGEEKDHSCRGGGAGGGEREINKEASVLGRKIGFYLGTFLSVHHHTLRPNQFFFFPLAGI